MLQSLAKLISVLFHPIFLPVYGYALLLFGSFIAHVLPVDAKLLLLVLIFLLTALVPITFLLFLKQKKMIDDLHISKASQRTIPYVITLVFYAITYYNLTHENLPQLLSFFMMAACVTLLTTLLINLKFKLSAHLVGVGAICASIYFMNQRFVLDLSWLFLVCVFLGGCVGFSRLFLKAHSPKEVYVGFCVGFLVQASFLFFFS